MRRDLLGFCAGLARTYGDVVYYHLGPVGNYQLTHPEHIQDVLVRQARRFHRPARTKRIWRKFDGEGLSVTDGEFWLRQRRLVQPAFAPQRLRGYREVMARCARELAGRWQGRAEVNAAEEMARLTLEVVTRTLLGVDLSGEAARIGAAMAVIQETVVREMSQAVLLPDWLPLPGKIRQRRANRYLHGLVEGLIHERRASGADRGDLLSMLLLAVDEQGDGRGMSDRQARDEAVTLLLAGYETTANALVWTVYLLARHPAAQEELAAGVRQALGGRLPGPDDLPALGAVEAAFKEALRLYPPVYFYSREATEDTEVAGYPVPRGSLVHVVPYLVHRDARWFERPWEFVPGRFAAGGEERLPPFAYFPFGGGPHVCVGKAFATAEAVLTLSAVLQAYRLAPAPGQGEAEYRQHLTLYPKGGVRLALSRRDAAAVTAGPGR
jgi:cytochrome P450